MSSAKMMTMFGLTESAAQATIAVNKMPQWVRNAAQKSFLHMTIPSILNIGKLFAIVEIFFQPVKFVRQFLPRRRISRLLVNIVEFVRILPQIEQFPLVDAIEINQFVAIRAHAVMRLHPMIGRVMVVTIIH